MLKFHRSMIKLVIILCMIISNSRGQRQQRKSEIVISHPNNLNTESNDALRDEKVKDNVKLKRKSTIQFETIQNCTTGDHFNQTHQINADIDEICRHHDNERNESQPNNNSTGRKSDIIDSDIDTDSQSQSQSDVESERGLESDSDSDADTSLCLDDNLPCNLTRDEYMQKVYDYLRPGVIKWILILSHTLVFAIGLMGNALVCLAVYVNYSMRTVTNIFIVNLAVADFLVILVCLPPSVVWDITETWFLGETMCKIVIYFQTVSVTVSVLTLTLISIDRWYAICFPLRYRTKISRAITSVSIIWIIAILLDIPEFLALTVKGGNLPYESILFSQCVTTWSESTEKQFYLTKLILLFIFPLLLMIAAYFKIATVLWKSDALLVGLHTTSQRSTTTTTRLTTGSSNRGTISQLQARRKAAKMMVVVVIMFAICYLPVHIFNLLRHTGKLEAGEITKILALCSHWLCYANSAINPVIYNFMSGKFRREFRNAFVKCRCSSVRVEDNFLYKNGPSSRQQNNSVSMRSYHNLSVRDITRPPYSTNITQKTNDSHL